MKKNRIFILGIVTMFVAILSLTLVSGTLAKYTSTVTGSNTATVAKWAWQYKGNNLTLNNDVVTFELFDTVYDEDGTEEEDVADGVIAPGTSGSFIISFTNLSEVNAQVKVDFTSNEEVAPIKYSTDGSTWKDTIAELSFDAAVAVDMNGTLEKEVFWKWEFEETDNGWNNAQDTALGKNPIQHTVSMTVTFDQVQ